LSEMRARKCWNYKEPAVLGWQRKRNWQSL